MKDGGQEQLAMTPHSTKAMTDSPARAATPAAHVPPLPLATMQTLASRFRGAGLFLVALDRDGAVTFHDADAPSFFTRFVLPVLQSPAAYRPALSTALQQMTPNTPGVVWTFLPGAIAAVYPQLEKRTITGTLALIAKSEGFTLDEDVVREANRFSIDALWLQQQADAIPSYGEEAVARQAKLLASMARDQVRLGVSQQEIDSLSGQLANSYEELSLIYQISSGMRVNRSAGDFFRQACLDVMEVIPLRGMGVVVTGDEGCRQGPALWGTDEFTQQQVDRLAGDLLDVLRVRKSPLLVNNLAADKRFGWLKASRLIAVPLQRQDEVLGCLFGLDKRGGDFDSVDAKLLNAIANESAIYLENAILFDDVRELMMGVLRSLTSAVDAKDAYTCGHSERVAMLSRRLAVEMSLPEEHVQRIYMAGIIHDVGKIGVPEAVLHKTGKLTAEEFEQMKKHPQIGARILADIKQIQDLIPGVLHHHERYDGKGYPVGLSGQKIPLMGRIICVADCFDAMTSNRTYRRALPLEVALIEVRRCAGTQFDPELAEAFLRIPQQELRQLLLDYQAKVAQTVPTPELVRI
jgi:HD-GYP domain-containing protein (c-di-GMP phosphodiesterase class II)